MARAEGVARVLTFGDGGDFESWRKFGGQVFQGVHGEIDASGGEGFFNFLGKHALGANHGQSDVGDFVAGGVDDFDFDVVAARAQERGNVVGLPQGELRTARADAESGHYCRVPASFLLSGAGACLSCKLNSLRTTSTTVVASDSFAAVFSVVMGVCMTLLMMPRVRASTAISCSGVRWPMRPRTRSISAWRIVSR